MLRIPLEPKNWKATRIGAQSWILLRHYLCLRKNWCGGIDWTRQLHDQFDHKGDGNTERGKEVQGTRKQALRERRICRGWAFLHAGHWMYNQRQHVGWWTQTARCLFQQSRRCTVQIMNALFMRHIVYCIIFQWLVIVLLVHEQMEPEQGRGNDRWLHRCHKAWLQVRFCYGMQYY